MLIEYPVTRNPKLATLKIFGFNTFFMPEQKLIESIRKELTTIMDIIDKVESIEELPAIEREIVLSKLRRVYEDLSEVSQHKVETGDQIDPEAENVILEQNNIHLEEGMPDDSEEQGPDQPMDEVSQEAIPDQPAEEIHEEVAEEDEVKEEVESSDQAEEVGESLKEKQPGNRKKSQPGIIAEKLTGERQVVYDSLADNSSRDNISTKLQSKPITNIAAVIGINDKFQLIRDLFNGDSATFSKTLEILNGATNFNEAFTYINENFDWDMEDPSVQFILDLVRRKFITNKDV